MTEVWNWFVNLPKNASAVMEWLTSPIMDLQGAPTPLGLLGVSIGVLLGVVFVLHVVHLVNPLG